VRPEYVGKRHAREGLRGDFYTPEEIEKIRRAGSIAARALAEVEKAIAPGVTTDTLDAIAHQFLSDNGAYPSTLGYRGFPKSCCTSINEVICHGIPDDTVVEDGDIINVDITAYLDGMHGDTNRTYLVGNVSDEARALVERTEEAMHRGIRAVKPGRQINVIGRAIEAYANRFGYGVVRDFTGHGVGAEFHSGLIVPHYDAAPAANELMDVGMVFTIEPMLTLGDYHWDMWSDGWTVTTKDKNLSAQFEHTIVVTETGAEILTLP
jgi:methionyl aminopeptidase